MMLELHTNVEPVKQESGRARPVGLNVVDDSTRNLDGSQVENHPPVLMSVLLAHALQKAAVYR